MRRFSFVMAFIVLAGFAVSMPKAAHACSCAIGAGESEEERARGAVEGAQAVFAGEVTGVEDEPVGTVVSTGDPIEVNFDVSRVWKGPAYETLTVEKARSGASCGYDFDKGRQYLVYADNTSVTGEDSEALQVSLCSETTPVSDTDAAANLLGKEGIVPQAESPDPQGSQTNAVLPDTGGASLFAIGVAVAGVGLALLVRKWAS